MDDVSNRPTSSRLLLAALGRHAHRTAITVEGQDWSYAAINDLSDRLAGFLAEQGVGPSVRDAAVVGIPHSDWGEAVSALVIAEESCIAEDIRQFAKARLSAYKVPKTVQIVKSLPLTQYGKIDKRRIRERLTEAARNH